MPGLGQATYFSAVCVESAAAPKIQIQINKGDLNATTVENQLQMIINGSFMDIAQIEQGSNITQEISGISSNLLFQRTNSSLTVLLSTGVSLTIEAKNVRKCLPIRKKNSNFLNIDIYLLFVAISPVLSTDLELYKA